MKLGLDPSFLSFFPLLLFLCCAFPIQNFDLVSLKQFPRENGSLVLTIVTIWELFSCFVHFPICALCPLPMPLLGLSLSLNLSLPNPYKYN